ncbi:unnamed protein product [Paramecium pentaurelia]|uniref:Cyclic nucleotide-binding domain-containing protein n=1 Tax=Paramecium pentaurelia TaxID=43138 RepID=A0A8S1W806_9CILI|nr:unnamed protein product [Paramecium pentaurelia]
MQLISDREDPEQLITQGACSVDIPTQRNRPSSQYMLHGSQNRKLKTQATVSIFGTFNTQEDKTTITRDTRSVFTRIVRKLIIIQCFFDSLEQYRKERLQQRIEFYFQKRTKMIPFYPDDCLIVYWMKVITLLQFCSCIIYPMFITFDDLEHDLYFIVLILDVLFSIDILLTFLTAYIDETSSLKISLVDIAMHYLKTWFIFDSISIFPWIYIGQDNLRFFRLCRILKYFIYKRKHSYKGQAEQQKVIPSFMPDNNMQLKEGIKFIIDVMVTAFLLIHIFACGYHYLLGIQYLDAFYQSTQTITTIGYGDYAQSIMYEYQILWLIIGVGFYTFTIGDFAYMMQRSGVNQDDEYYFELEQLCYISDFPEKIKNQFQRFITTNLNNNAFWSSYHKKMVHDLPYQIQNYLVLSGMLQICEAVPFFMQDINFTIELLNDVQFLVIEENDLIYREGQNSNEIYFLLQGDVRIMTKTKFTLLNILEGTMFGEYEAIEETLRTTYAIALQRSLILKVDYAIFEKSMKMSPNLYFEVQQLFHRRRKLLINNLKVQKSQRSKVRRSVLIQFSHVQLQQTRQDMKKQREIREIKNINEYHQLVLQQLIDKKRHKYDQLLTRFKSVVFRIIHYNQQLIRTPPEDWKDLDNYNLIKRVFPLRCLSDKFQVFFRKSSSVHSQSVHRSSIRRRIDYNHQYNKFNWRLSDVQIKQIILMHNKRSVKIYPTLKNIVQNYQGGTVASSPQRINRFYPKWIKDLVQEDHTIEEMEQFVWKYHQINKRLDRIDKMWTKGLIIRFDKFKLKSQKDLDHLDTESSDEK